MDKLTPMETLRRIRLNQQYEKVHGVLLDATTATALLTVYDALSEASQVRFEALLNRDATGLQKLVDFAWSKVS